MTDVYFNCETCGEMYLIQLKGNETFEDIDDTDKRFCASCQNDKFESEVVQK